MVQNINKQKDHELINIINTINMQLQHITKWLPTCFWKSKSEIWDKNMVFQLKSANFIVT